MKICMLISAVMMAFALCSCGTTETVIVPIEPTAVTEIRQDAVSVQPSEAPEEIPLPEYVVNIYHGDDNAEKILYEGIVINDLAPQILLDKLYEQGVFSAPVSVLSFTVDNYNVIHLDLDESFASQINSMGTSGEHIMMGSLVNTFLDAFDADGLSLTVNGSILESGHAIYDFTMSFFQ